MNKQPRLVLLQLIYNNVLYVDIYSRNAFACSFLTLQVLALIINE